MQQATTAKPPNDSAPSGTAVPQAPRRTRFVINLCGSTTPVSLTPPDHAGLKRFTFFVSRRREEGRERFRLHMGYFDSQEEAERLLDIVREIYPAAWAGLAPGQRLQAQADAAAAALSTSTSQSASEPLVATAPAASPPAAATVPAPVAAAATTPAAPVAPAPAAAVSANTARVEAALSQTPATATTAADQPVDGAVEVPALSLVPDEARRLPNAGVAKNKKEDVDAAARALSNVRAAIASLDDTASRAPTLSPLPELKPATEAREISDSAALQVLESRVDSGSESTVNQPRLTTAEPAPSSRNDKTAFAVQLLWSVQPIDITQIPQLAIFSAYTLYGAEGNRDGRRWYGVRLGFFTDAVSAKQVAHYVRSDFSTVSVVPVTARERERARLAATRPDATPVAPAAPVVATAAAEAKSPAPSAPTAAFEFIDDKQPAPERAGTALAARTARGAPGKRAKLRPTRQVNGRAKSKPMTLEETLEILGAGELKMDEGRRASINDGLTQLPQDAGSKGKPSRFGRLLERLSERLGS